ncbi:class I SAM-dependent methyltransferase [Alisedimentitalea sp. MJ-SS2]|uniref:class I SAM-dependent methyltransferase n=1 Tax=Aliisedimentitalea sp. MJ-SS2 TaxID=3049795 RepID=UPI00290B74F8|nr:class I SAM-dependent methyltransferase [Alisedimentitalea sp. MJ-SS2]MDU8926033.1 class I SAM-dependent methyltransferase [Alisedimentitalea sp. MJ-SS2]
MKAESVTSSYRRWAPIYDRTFGAVTNAGRRRAGMLFSQLGGHVLEVGVGTGLALPLYKGDVQVTGIDFSHEMLAKAKARVTAERLTHVTALRQMDARHLDFPDGSFDHVAAMHVLSVVPEPEKVLAEIARVLRPGGRLVVTNHFARDRGALAALERVSAPLENLLGWQSDFPISTVLDAPGFSIVEQDSLPPMGMMTWLVMERQG